MTAKSKENRWSRSWVLPALLVLFVAAFGAVYLRNGPDVEGVEGAEVGPLGCSQIVPPSVPIPLPEGETRIGVVSKPVSGVTNATINPDALDVRPIVSPAPDDTAHATSQDAAIAVATAENFRQAKATAQLAYASTPGDRLALDDSGVLKSLDHQLIWLVNYQFPSPQLFPIHGEADQPKPECFFSNVVMMVDDATGAGLLSWPVQ